MAVYTRGNRDASSRKGIAWGLENARPALTGASGVWRNIGQPHGGHGVPWQEVWLGKLNGDKLEIKKKSDGRRT